MARIIELDTLVPEDIEFRKGDRVYRVPGDLSTEHVFKLQRLWDAGAALTPDASLEQRQEYNLQAEQLLLDIFRIEQPDLDRFPFGFAGASHVLLQLLVQLGLAIIDKPDGDPTRPPAKRKPAAKTTRSRRSGRSSGSRVS